MRLVHILVIALFGYIGGTALFQGKIYVGRLHHDEIRREDNPLGYWLFTGLMLVVTLDAGVCLVRTFRRKNADGGEGETSNQSLEP